LEGDLFDAEQVASLALVFLLLVGLSKWLELELLENAERENASRVSVWGGGALFRIKSFGSG